MNVAAELQQVLIAFNQLRFVTPLGHVPDSMVTEIVVNGVSRDQARHEAAKISAWGLQQKMQVVGHEANQVEADTVEFLGLCQALQKPASVGIVAVNKPPLVATHGHVKNGSWKLYSEQPRHPVDARLNAPSLSIQFNLSASACPRSQHVGIR